MFQQELVLKDVTGPLPTSQFDFVVDNKIVGLLQVRHKPSVSAAFPSSMASNIYYEILPEERGKGYGTIILKLGLEEARKIGLHEVFITIESDNIPSKKIIESNEGIFLDSFDIDNNKKLLKYIINL